MRAPAAVMRRYLVFATRAYARLGSGLAARAGWEKGRTEVFVWPGGEVYQRVADAVSGWNAVLVAGTGTEADTLEAFDLACALLDQGALSLTLMIPFFGYATMERRTRDGEAVTAKSRARLWSALPAAPEGKRILVWEPHTPGLPFYFGDGARVSTVDARPWMIRILAEFASRSPVLCSPDIGRIKWVDGMAMRLGWPSAFVLKRRSGRNGAQAFGLSGEVSGRLAVLCDDLVRTGATLEQAARLCLDAGASGVSAVAVHGAFAPGALESLESGSLIESLHCSDSHPAAAAGAGGWLRIESCAGSLAEAISA